MRTCAKVGICLVTLGLLAGCMMITPSIFYPKTSVHGLVLDQNDKSVPSVKIEVRKDWPYSMIGLITMSGPCSKWNIEGDEQGRWKVSARKVGRLYVEAIPPSGYKPVWPENSRKETIAGPFGSGECPTNDFILRLEKLRVPEKGSK